MRVSTENDLFGELEPENRGSKGVQVSQQEDGSIGNLAAPGHREESASHQMW